MSSKNKKKYTKTVLPMAKNHSWKAPPGYQIAVIDRGAVSFNFPAGWMIKGFDPLEIHDGDPPNDNARIMVTVFNVPRGVDWSGLPLGPLLLNAVQGGEIKILERSVVHEEPRTDIQVMWLQQKFRDPVEPRDAYSRIAMARGQRVHVLITFDFWVDQAEQMTPVWDEVLRSLLLDRVIQDPTKGEVLH